MDNVYCSECGKKLDGIIYLDYYGNPHCIDCMADKQKTDDDWEVTDVYEYTRHQKEQEYLAYCDRKYEELRDIELCQA